MMRKCCWLILFGSFKEHEDLGVFRNPSCVILWLDDEKIFTVLGVLLIVSGFPTTPCLLRDLLFIRGARNCGRPEPVR